MVVGHWGMINPGQGSAGSDTGVLAFASLHFERCSRKDSKALYEFLMRR